MKMKVAKAKIKGKEKVEKVSLAPYPKVEKMHEMKSPAMSRMIGEKKTSDLHSMSGQEYRTKFEAEDGGWSYFTNEPPVEMPESMPTDKDGTMTDMKTGKKKKAYFKTR
jgi:hypothetical protein